MNFKTLQKNLASQKQKILLEKVCNAFGFTSSDDRKTIINRKSCGEECRKIIDALEADIVKYYPRDFTRKLRSGKRDPKSNLTIMREILRYNRRHLVSIRGFKWCKAKKKSVGVYTYFII